MEVPSSSGWEGTRRPERFTNTSSPPASARLYGARPPRRSTLSYGGRGGTADQRAVRMKRSMSASKMPPS
eukprot:691865-Pyramimonas_sp.AAC.1